MSIPVSALTRRLDLTSLQLFVAVCEAGSIGRAADQEHIAASAISKRLSDLEAALHAPLLERHARGVTLTPAGESLLRHARNLLLDLQQMQQELAEYAQGVRGHVRVLASISALVEFLPEDLGRFALAHEHIKIELQEHLSPDIVRAVRDGKADFGIGNFVHGETGLQTRPYRQDELVLVVPGKHRLARCTQPIAFADTLDDDHIGLQALSSIHQATRHAALLAGRPMRMRISVSGLDAMCRMIANGLGIGVMPRRAFDLLRGPAALVALTLADPWATRQLELVARDFSSLSQAAGLLAAHLLDAPAPITIRP